MMIKINNLIGVVGIFALAYACNSSHKKNVEDSPHESEVDTPTISKESEAFRQPDISPTDQNTPDIQSSKCEDTKWTKIFGLEEDGWLQPLWASNPDDIFVSSSSGTIYHFDGNSWKKQADLSPSRIWSIDGSSRENLFAVGGYRTIAHYDGKQWIKEYFDKQASPKNAFEEVIVAKNEIHVFGEAHYYRTSKSDEWSKFENENSYPWTGTPSYWKIRGTTPPKSPPNIKSTVMEKMDGYWVVQGNKQAFFLKAGDTDWKKVSKNHSCRIEASINNQLLSLCENTINVLGPSGTTWNEVALPVKKPQLMGHWTLNGHLYIQLQPHTLFKFNGTSWEKSLDSESTDFTNMKLIDDYIFSVTKKAVYCRKLAEKL